MISAAQLLDELMGRDRNLAPDEKRSNVRWDHESVHVKKFMMKIYENSMRKVLVL